MRMSTATGDDRMLHDDHHDEDFDPQDMRNMGGLRKRMPITYLTYLIGTLGLAGIFPFAGFWSKDEILADAWYEGFELNETSGFIAFGVLLVAAAFTAFLHVAASRAGLLRQAAQRSRRARAGEQWRHAAAADHSGHLHLHHRLHQRAQSHADIRRHLPDPYEFKHFLEHSLVSVSRGHSLDFNLLIAGIALALGIASIMVAHRVYKGKGLASDNRDQLETQAPARGLFQAGQRAPVLGRSLHRVHRSAFQSLGGFLADRIDWDFLHDYFHDRIIKRGFDSIAEMLSKPVDLGIVDGTVNGVGIFVQRAADWMRRSQTGYVRLYAVVLFIGVVAVILLMLIPIHQTLLQSGS